MFKKILITLIVYFNFINYVYSDIIKDFQINGNDRISKETIILFTGYKVQQNINSDDLNNILKNLYGTTFFEDVSINFENNILLINVKENPLIQSIIFEGIKKQSLVERLKDILILKEKSSFVESKIKSDQNRIINSLRVNGYYFSEVTASVIKNNNNTVEIIYNIKLGEKALIRNIKFIGNKVFKDNKLRKVIVSEEAKFWKFISTKKNVDINRIKFDETLLQNFYKNRGYYNVKINSSYAQIIEDKYFEIVFNIDAGEKYFFNLTLDIPLDYKKEDFQELQKVLKDLSSKPYSLNRIEDILDEIDLVALNKNYEFVSASYDETIIDNNKINLNIKIKDAEKFYIEKLIFLEIILLKGLSEINL